MQNRTDPHPSDVTLTCPCCGASASVPIRRYRAVCRLESPAHELALHAAVTRHPELLLG